MTIGAAPLCVLCKHFTPDGEGFTCAAFPGGIPESIISSKVDHRVPVGGDGGIVFAPGAGVDEKLVERHARLLGLE